MNFFRQLERNRDNWALYEKQPNQGLQKKKKGSGILILRKRFQDLKKPMQKHFTSEKNPSFLSYFLVIQVITQRVII